jgi:hypothetical protein
MLKQVIDVAGDHPCLATDAKFRIEVLYLFDFSNHS